MQNTFVGLLRVFSTFVQGKLTLHLFGADKDIGVSHVTLFNL